MTSVQPQMRYDPRWGLDADSKRYRSFIMEQDARFLDHFRGLARQANDARPKRIPLRIAAIDEIRERGPRDVIDVGTVRAGPGGRPTAAQIMAGVALRYGVQVGDLLSHKRDRNLTAARFEAIAIVRDTYPEWSLPHIGRVFNRDHTSILYALRKRKERALPPPGDVE